MGFISSSTALKLASHSCNCCNCPSFSLSRNASCSLAAAALALLRPRRATATAAVDAVCSYHNATCQRFRVLRGVGVYVRSWCEAFCFIWGARKTWDDGEGVRGVLGVGVGGRYLVVAQEEEKREALSNQGLHRCSACAYGIVCRAEREKRGRVREGVEGERGSGGVQRHTPHLFSLTCGLLPQRPTIQVSRSLQASRSLSTPPLSSSTQDNNPPMSVAAKLSLIRMLVSATSSSCDSSAVRQ
jgi:hypothetical protein